MNFHPHYLFSLKNILITGGAGLLGFEQVFLRISEAVDNKTIQTSKKLIIIILFVWAVFGLLSSIGFMSFFSSLDVNSIYLIICTLSVTASIFLYNIFLNYYIKLD